MSGVSLPVSRPVGGAMLVGSASCRTRPLATLQAMGYTCAELDDPYLAMAALCRRPLHYRALILSVASLYREELQLIAAVKRRFPHIEIWLADTDGRQGTLADGMRFGADGLLADDGLHRIAVAALDSAPANHIEIQRPAPARPSGLSTKLAEPPTEVEHSHPEPVLSADELRALLHDQATAPPALEDGDNPPGQSR